MTGQREDLWSDSADSRKYILLARLIRQMITSGELRQGLPVPSSSRLTQEYDVSRETVTRAFGLLAGARLIRRYPGSTGYVVTWPDADLSTGNDPWMLESAPKYVQVADWVRVKIASEELEWRMVVPAVTELCRKFRISRPPVTRAMHLLVKEGLIEFVPRHGYYVVPGAKRPAARDDREGD